MYYKKNFSKKKELNVTIRIKISISFLKYALKNFLELWMKIICT